MSKKKRNGFRRGPTRRSLLVGAAATPVAMGAASCAGLRPAGWEPEVIKVGLIGCGGRGTGAALQAMRAEAGTVVLHAMGDVFAEKMDSCAERLTTALGEENAGRMQVDPEHRFDGFDAYRKVIASGVDVVILTTPPHFRHVQLRAALEAGKHVFCEKPMAVDGPGVRSVLESAKLAKARKLSLVSGFCWRYSIPHREMWTRILDGQLGDLRAVYTTYNAGPNGTHKRKPEWDDMQFQLKNWPHFSWLSGDHITEQACHSLDKMAWAMGDEVPEKVWAIGGRQTAEGKARGNIYDHFSATFEYANGVKGFHMARQWPACAFDNTDHILGEHGSAFCNGWAPIHRIESKKTWNYEGPGNDMYQQEHDELFASIRAGKPLNDGVWMAHSSMLAIMARNSAYTGQPVTWQEAMADEARLGPDTYAWGDLAVEPVPIPGRRKKPAAKAEA